MLFAASMGAADVAFVNAGRLVTEEAKNSACNNIILVLPLYVGYGHFSACHVCIHRASSDFLIIKPWNTSCFDLLWLVLTKNTWKASSFSSAFMRPRILLDRET